MKWNDNYGFAIDKDKKLWYFENQELSSFKEMIPENMIGEISKDKLLVNMNKLGKKNVKEIALTKRFLWVLDDSGRLH